MLDLAYALLSVLLLSSFCGAQTAAAIDVDLAKVEGYYPGWDSPCASNLASQLKYLFPCHPRRTHQIVTEQRAE